MAANGATVPAMRSGCWRSTLAVAALLAAVASARADDLRATSIDAASVRPANKAASGLIQSSALRSPTILRMIQQLNDTDVIAYVELTVAPHVLTAATTFAAAAANNRFLRIQINARAPVWIQVQMLGHELHHALEIAAEPKVVDAAAMRRFYERVGIRGRTPNQFETREAQDVQARVRREYAASGRPGSSH